MRLLPPAILSLLLWLAPYARAADDDSRSPTDTLGVADTVIVIGNEKTKSYVITDEMFLQPGSPVTPEAIVFDRNRIYSLGLFTSVEIFYDSLSTPHALFVMVKERWYIIPFPIFGFRFGDPKKIFFGGGVLHNNLGGRNKKLYAAFAFGYDPSASLYYLDPLLDADARLTFSANATYSRTLNKSETQAAISGDFFEYRVNLAPTLGKRLSLYQSTTLTVGYQDISVSSYQPGRTVGTQGRDQFLYAVLSYIYDSRDLAEYPSRGYNILLSLMKNGFGEDDVNWARYVADLRGFYPLTSRLTLGCRAAATLVSGGEVPTYSHAYFGYNEKLRGHYRTVYEGENLINSSLELRYSILPLHTIHASWIPLPEEFTVWRFGIALALFADAGTIWYRGDTVSLDSFYSGYGAGINFLLPYSFVVRTEYAWNEHAQGQFIVDFRVSF
jgi:outer membrane protein assembly factor BamA